MKPELAAAVREMRMGSLNQEFATTKKVIAAIPENAKEFRPDPKARTAYELAWHIVSSDVQMLDEIADGAFTMAERFPDKPATVAGMIEFYDREFSRALGRVKGLDAAALTRVIDFYGAFQFPAVVFLGFVESHSIHHRGQLSTYLRPMGSKVPSIYGGSADEPWKG